MAESAALMVADAQGVLPLPWLAMPLTEALQRHRGHALLLHGAAGAGALPFALTLAQAWLCEAVPPDQQHNASGPVGPCGHCGSCKLVQAQLHPDLAVVLPETLRRQHGWLLATDKPDGDDKRKPSKQIRIDDVRGVIDWATRTSARGRGKVAVLHPAETLNIQAANALLKTLEEPPPGTRLLLTCADPALLLPTVRSRCQHQRLAEPAADVATAWLSAQMAAHMAAQAAGDTAGDTASAAVLLAACSGRPLDALDLAQAGVDAQAWTALPGAVAHGHAAALAGWPVPRALDALQKICHDAMAVAAGGAPRFFPLASVHLRSPGPARIAALSAWGRELARVARHDEHPWNEGLLLEALVQGGAQALAATLPP